MKEKQILSVCKSADPLLHSQTNPLDRILVVDDDGDIRRLNAAELIDSGYDVDVAEDGVIAWEALQSNSYDLLVTDNSMPRMSGLELIKKMRSARMAMPVILASGTVPTREFVQNPSLQPTAMLLKPYITSGLLRMVKKVLREAVDTGDGPQLPVHGDTEDRTISRLAEPTDAAQQCHTHSTDCILVGNSE